MTIEIKQLIIRAVVEKGPERARAAGAPQLQAPGPAPASAALAPPPEPGPGLDALVAECTRQVLRELRKRKGR